MQANNHSLYELIDNISITGLSMDSRTVKSGDLFFALNPLYIDEAIEKGAKIIFCEKKSFNAINTINKNKKYNIPIIYIDNLRDKIGYFAAEYYHSPSQYLHLIGVTGTNGKTSCTHFIAQAFKLAGYQSAVMGTLGNGLIDHVIPGTLTTPDSVTVQKLLADFYQQKTDFVAMEASSHGLDQGRLNGTEIETAIFTNLTRDHLDYHKTIENYAAAKFRLFEHPYLKHAILNLDDPYGMTFAEKLLFEVNKYKKLELYGITLQENKFALKNIKIISASDIQINPSGQTAIVNTPWGTGELSTELLGKFNLTNLLCALTTLGIYHIDLDKILTYLSQIKSVPGRMEILGGINGKPLVIIDYAHTPDALSKTLKAIREHCEGNLWCVFGCGGDRDQGKRPEMGRIAEEIADHVILTDDNPRHENPAKIIADIRTGLSLTSQKNIFIEHDRRQAISYALSIAKTGDIVLIAGKGHETYQEIGGQKIPFNDSLVVKLLLLEQG